MNATKEAKDRTFQTRELVPHRECEKSRSHLDSGSQHHSSHKPQIQ